MARVLLLLLFCCPVLSQTPTHFIYVIKENRSMDNFFATFPHVQNYAFGGHSAKLCTNNQKQVCSMVGTHDVCGSGWCQPAMCEAPTGTGINGGPGATGGDTCPYITTYETGDGSPLTLQSASVSYVDTLHDQATFLKQFNNGQMNGFSNTPAPTLVYYDCTQVQYYCLLASTYGLADNHFSTLGGPSQPNHLYMFAASSNESSDNPSSTQPGAGSPGENNFTRSWACGALHTGTKAPYLYTGTLASTRASDGKQYYGGTCANDRTKACTCVCTNKSGKCGVNTFDPGMGGAACSDVANCGSVGNLCDDSLSIGGTPGAPCPTITTIADVAESVLGTGSTSWGYYSYNGNWNAALQSQGIYFNPTRLAAHVHHDYDFDSDVTSCTGMCSNNNTQSCSLDADCGNGACIDSSSCRLPKIVFLSPDEATDSEHPPGPISAGKTWTKTRLSTVFHNSYVYNHSIVMVTFDDWGGKYDHVPPPVQNAAPSLGMRVPLLCVGPKCKNQVTHTEFEFTSVLKCIENLFNLPNLNSRDAGAVDACAGTGTLFHNTDGMVNLSQPSIPPLP